MQNIAHTVTVACAGTLFAASALADDWTWTLPLDDAAGWQTEGEVQFRPESGPGGAPALELYLDAKVKSAADLVLPARDVDLTHYDRLVCDMFFEGSQILPRISLFEWPGKKQMCNWYGKLEDRPMDAWFHWEVDLNLDDDGIALTPGYCEEPRTQTTVRLHGHRSFTREAGEPQWRHLRYANVRLVRYPVILEFSRRNPELEQTRERIAARYAIDLVNRESQPVNARVELLSGSLHHFFASLLDTSGKPYPVDARIPLPAHGRQTVFLELDMPMRKAQTLPALHSEMASLAVWADAMPKIRYTPIWGYRPIGFWAAVPVFGLHYPTPAETMANLRAMDKVYPGLLAQAEEHVGRMRQVLDKPLAMCLDGPPLHNSGYQCPTCNKRTLTASNPPYEHTCRKCGGLYGKESGIWQHWIDIHHGGNGKLLLGLAKGWQYSGDDAFARKGIELLKLYADNFEKAKNHFPAHPMPRSTSAGSRLGCNMLMDAFATPNFFRAYNLLAGSRLLSDVDRQHIQNDFMLNAAYRMMHHGGTNNQLAEYFRAIFLAAFYSKQWAMAGEALYGSQGWFRLLKDGYTADGIGHEGGAYHRTQMHAMADIAIALDPYCKSLWNPRFKQVFVGTATGSVEGIAAHNQDQYEAAYRVYRDPVFLPTVRAFRRSHPVNLITAQQGVVGLPESADLLTTSTDQSGTGYLFLRRGLPDGGHRVLAVNYGMQLDRSENDRLHVRMFVEGVRISGQIARLNYGNKFAKNMYRSFGHSVVTIDRQDNTPARARLVSLQRAEGVEAALFCSAGVLHAGSTWYRVAAIVDSHFVVIDHVIADKPCRIDWHWYFQSPEVVCSLPMQPGQGVPGLWEEPLPEGSTGAWQHALTDAPFTVDAGLGFRFRGDRLSRNPVPRRYSADLTQRVHMVPHGETDAQILTVMQHYVSSLKPMLRLTKANARKATFAALFQTCLKTDDRPVSLARDDDALAWTILVGPRSWRISLSPGANPKVSVAPAR